MGDIQYGIAAHAFVDVEWYVGQPDAGPEVICEIGTYAILETVLQDGFRAFANGAVKESH
jgi:hypothetical protein